MTENTTDASRACPRCGSAVTPGQAFCANCGAPAAAAPATPPAVQPVSAPPAAGAAIAPPPQTWGGFLGAIGSERTGVMAALVVFVVCVALSYITWSPLAEPSKLIRDALPEADCRGETPGSTSMYFCSAKVGLLQLAGPIILMGLIFVFRRQIKAWLDKSLPSLPKEGRFLFAPVIATLAFTLSWAGFHYDTGDLNGLLPQRMFPVVVGMFTYSVARWGPALQVQLAGFFTWRDTFPVVARIAVLVGVPMLISYLSTNQDRVSDTATKEQVVVLVSLALGFLMLAPKQGNVLSGMGQTVGSLRRQA